VPAARHRRWLTGAVVAVVAICVALALRSQWRVIAKADWQLEPERFTLATVLLAVSFAIVAWLWGVALRGVAGVPVRRGMRIWFLANLARYVPGSVWSILGAVELARREGAPRRSAASVVALTQLLNVGVALLIGLPVIVAEFTRYGRPALAGLAVIVAGLAALWLARRPLIRLLRRRYPDLTWRDVFPSGRLAVGLTLGYAVYWIVAGLAFGIFASAVHPPAGEHLVLAVAAFSAAYAIGFLSLLTPSGLGVREGVLVAVLAGVMPAGVAAVVAVLARLWMMAVELLGAGVTLALAGRGPGLSDEDASDEDERAPGRSDDSGASLAPGDERAPGRSDDSGASLAPGDERAPGTQGAGARGPDGGTGPA
jgi:uncharacterized membrane protein YbhN (UPF0104 family)